MLHSLIKETGWTWHYVLWKVSRANLLLMIADRSDFKNRKDADVAIRDSGKNLFNRIRTKKATNGQS